MPRYAPGTNLLRLDDTGGILAVYVF
jgi:hypothetical protein